MKNRWIALYVENQVGVLAKVSGLFSGKSYNLQSLTVGTTEDETVSRMTICVTSDDITFEQIKKQLNRMVEVIKVIDLTNVPVHMKEILFAKVLHCTTADKEEVFQIAQVFNVQVADIGKDSVLLECKLTERRNNELIALLKSKFKTIEVVRGGAVAIESEIIQNSTDLQMSDQKSNDWRSAFFIAKYSFDLKKKIVFAYLSGKHLKDLSNIHRMIIFIFIKSIINSRIDKIICSDPRCR